MSLNKASLHPYFWGRVRYVRGDRLNSHNVSFEPLPYSILFQKAPASDEVTSNSSKRFLRCLEVEMFRRYLQVDCCGRVIVKYTITLTLMGKKNNRKSPSDFDLETFVHGLVSNSSVRVNHFLLIYLGLCWCHLDRRILSWLLSLGDEKALADYR